MSGNNELSLETLIRDTVAAGYNVTIGIVTANDTDGFSACTVRPPQDGAPLQLVNIRDADPIAAMRAVMIEQMRRDADLRRRYEAAPKVGDTFDMKEILG